MFTSNIKKTLTNLYEGDSSSAYYFRYTLLILDIVTVMFLVVSSFFSGSEIIFMIDIVFGLYITLDYFARLWIAPKKGRFFINFLNIADLIAILSFLLPLLSGQFAFLRGFRILRLLRSYRLQNRLRHDFAYFKRHEHVTIRATNLFVFVFIMTEMILVTQVGINPKINDFLDALYFAISTLTTTGFGDIVLKGKDGYVLSIITMMFGVSLFLRLIHSIFLTPKLHSSCNKCNLSVHENDSKHCRHCGTFLEINNMPHHSHANSHPNTKSNL